MEPESKLELRLRIIVGFEVLVQFEFRLTIRNNVEICKGFEI